MRLVPDCIVCNLNAALMAIRELTLEPGQVRALTADIMQIPAMRALDWSLTGSQLVEHVFTRIITASGNPDPFRRLKEQQNQQCLALYPRLKELVIKSDDPLFTAVNLSIIGNSIDPMGKLNPDDVEQAIRRSLANPVPRDRVAELKDHLQQSRRVLYLGDNCGEIVSDKLLIETIKSHYDIEVTFVVRSVPALNDATMTEAKRVGIDEVATVVENGIDGPLPGTILSRCSEQMRSLWSHADLVISKGGGNFDSLDEEEGITVPLFYMLMCKCNPYRDYFKIPLNYPILSRAPSIPHG